MTPMRCLFMTLPDTLDPWFTDVQAALEEGIELVLYDPERPFADQVAGARAVVDLGGSVSTRATIDAAADAGVELIQVHGTGLDHVDVGYMLSRGLRVAHCSGVHSAPALAEHALCLLLAVVKGLPQSRVNVERRILYVPLNEELEGKAVLLVGFGASARELAKRVGALGVRVLAIDHVKPDGGVLERLGVERFADPSSLDELIPEADIISLHLPLTAETANLIDRRRLRLMRAGSVLVNVSRGGLVDEEALVEALMEGRLGGAGLDVFCAEPLPSDHPLLRLPNVVLTPHTAGVTFGTSQRRGAASAENLRRLRAGLPLLDELFAAP